MTVDLSASGYTPRKQLVLSTSIAYTNCVRSPLFAVVDTALRFIGFPQGYFTKRWNEIPLPENKAKLILGVLPVCNKLTGSSDLITLTDPIGTNIESVLCMTEGFENHLNGFIIKSVTPNDWKSKDINFLQIETPDHAAVSEEKIEQGVMYLHDQLSQGRNVYLHCKAGMSRSATIAVCYLCTFYPDVYPTFESALEHLQKHRSQVWIEESQLENAINYTNTKELDFFNDNPNSNE